MGTISTYWNRLCVWWNNGNVKYWWKQWWYADEANIWQQ